MNAVTPADSLHRLMKQALDSGAATSIGEAAVLFSGYRVHFAVDPGDVARPESQAALLTGVALARRVFLGGVSVSCTRDVELCAPFPEAATLADAVTKLGGQIALAEPVGKPCIVIGTAPRVRSTSFQLRMVYDGWRGGVLPAHVNAASSTVEPMPLAPMLAAALAVSEAFFHVQGIAIAGKRAMGMSLWQPGMVDWQAPEPDAPRLRYLPSSLWLIGLGHLGQAFLWALGLLPYRNPAKAHLVLQDVDTITPSTESTSVLTAATMAGTFKTRQMAAWAEQRGFTTAMHERLFDVTFTRADTDPTIALCGLDNALGRHALDTASFPFVVEAGLGRGHRDFRTIRMHTLPGLRKAVDIWGGSGVEEDVSDQAAYQGLLNRGELDKCGVTLLAGKAVGAPFVGAVAACLVISEVLRLLHGGPLHQLIDLDLHATEHRLAVPHHLDFAGLNPGYVNVI